VLFSSRLEVEEVAVLHFGRSFLIEAQVTVFWQRNLSEWVYNLSATLPRGVLSPLSTGTSGGGYGLQRREVLPPQVTW